MCVSIPVHIMDYLCSSITGNGIFNIFKSNQFVTSRNQEPIQKTP